MEVESSPYIESSILTETRNRYGYEHVRYHGENTVALRLYMKSLWGTKGYEVYADFVLTNPQKHEYKLDYVLSDIGERAKYVGPPIYGRLMYAPDTVETPAFDTVAEFCYTNMTKKEVFVILNSSAIINEEEEVTSLIDLENEIDQDTVVDLSMDQDTVVDLSMEEEQEEEKETVSQPPRRSGRQRKTPTWLNNDMRDGKEDNDDDGSPEKCGCIIL